MCCYPFQGRLPAAETWTWTGVHREIGITVVITWADRNLGIGQNEESTKKAARI